MKKSIFSVLAILTILVINNNVLAFSFVFDDIHHNILQYDIGTLNSKIPEGLPKIAAESWPPSETQVVEDVKSYNFKFNNPVTWFIAKWGRDSQLIYVGGLSNFTLTSPNKNGLSYYAAVPEPSDMILLGLFLLFIIAIHRSRFRKFLK